LFFANYFCLTELAVGQTVFQGKRVTAIINKLLPSVGVLFSREAGDSYHQQTVTISWCPVFKGSG
jgi:hypothetical protein